MNSAMVILQADLIRDLEANETSSSVYTLVSEDTSLAHLTSKLFVFVRASDGAVFHQPAQQRRDGSTSNVYAGSIDVGHRRDVSVVNSPADADKSTVGGSNASGSASPQPQTLRGSAVVPRGTSPVGGNPSPLSRRTSSPQLQRQRSTPSSPFPPTRMGSRQSTPAGQTSAKSSSGNAQRSPSATDGASPSVGLFGEVPTTVQWPVVCCQQRGLREAMFELGGMHVLLYKLGTVGPTVHEQTQLLEFIFLLTQHSPENASSMRASEGYLLLNSFLKSERCVMASSMVRVLLHGAVHDPVAWHRSDTMQGGDGTMLELSEAAVITNTDLIEHVLMDWCVCRGGGGGLCLGSCATCMTACACPVVWACGLMVVQFVV